MAFLIGELIGIDIELGKTKNVFTAFFLVKFSEKKYCNMGYKPLTDSAKKVIAKSKKNTFFLCDVGKDNDGNWKIFNVYKNLEKLDEVLK